MAFLDTLRESVTFKQLNPANYGQDGDDYLERQRIKRRRGVIGESKKDRSVMSWHERRAVRAAEKENVGALSRPEKEAWVDKHIADNGIPKGPIGSAVYSGVMKVPAKSTKASTKMQVKSVAEDIKFAPGVYPANKKLATESVEELDEILTVSGRIKRGMDLRRNKAKLAMGRQRQSHRLADKDRLLDRARRHARTAIISRLTKGRDKSELSPQVKAELERRVEKMKGRVNIISKRLLPSIKAADIAKKRGNGKPIKKVNVTV